jgi:hypothetical protein
MRCGGRIEWIDHIHDADVALDRRYEERRKEQGCYQKARHRACFPSFRVLLPRFIGGSQDATNMGVFMREHYRI